MSTLRLKFSEKAAVNERTPTTDLLHHLIGQRAHLIAKMSNAHQRGGDVAGWLPLLAQTQAGIEAVEAAIRAARILRVRHDSDYLFFSFFCFRFSFRLCWAFY